LRITCDQLRNRHFHGQSFNSNPLLKLMLIKFPPKKIAKQLKEKCFTEESSVNFDNNHEFIIVMSRIHAKIHTINDIDRIESFDNFNHINSAMVTFFLDNGLAFRINHSFNLSRLLKRLDRLRLLFQKKIPMAKIIKFHSDNDVWRWNIEIFKKYLKKERKSCNPSKRRGISQEEYERYLGLSE
jgi:hypothetical protein